MEIRFRGIAPATIPARLETIRQARLDISRASFRPAALDLMHPLVCMTVTNITPVQAVEVKGNGGKIDLVRVDQLNALFNEGRVCFGYARDKNQDFLIWDQAFDEFAKEIYAHESMNAIRRFECNQNCESDQVFKMERDVFFRLEAQVTASSSAKNLRHLSFMLQEAAEIDGDYVTAAAILLHNMKPKDLDHLLNLGRKRSATPDRIAAEIKQTVLVFNNLNNTPYLPPEKRHEYQIQDSLNSMLRISRGNGRAIQLLFVHKLSSIIMQPEDAHDITGRAVRELYAPLAERLGKKAMASKLRNQAFRLHDPKNYLLHESKILNALAMSRKEAEDFVNRVQMKMRDDLYARDCGCHLTSGRVKTPWGAYAKSEYKSEMYPDIFLMTDLLAATGVTKTPIDLESAMQIVKEALGDDFNSFNMVGDQTETKRITVDAKVYLVHHIGVILKDNNSMEFQVMDKETYQTFDIGARAHWAYKLEKITRQKFDHRLLEICAKKMTGDLIRDVKMTCEILSQWVYAFILEGNDLRPIRVNAGAIPVDAAAMVMNEDFPKYGGSRIGKVWDAKNVRDAGEFNPLTDGDLIVFKRQNPGYLNDVGRRKLIVASQHPETKALLYPDDPPSSRGKKNLRRK